MGRASRVWSKASGVPKFLFFSRKSAASVANFFYPRVKPVHKPATWHLPFRDSRMENYNKSSDEHVADRAPAMISNRR